MGSGVLARGRTITVCAAAALVGCLSGCTQASNSTITVSGRTLSIYASEPPGGAGGQQARDAIAAEQLALQQAGGQAGKFRINFVKLAGKEPSANARSAIEDPSTIAYLGELVPGTSWISIQITNEQGVLEVSPLDTAAYLTQPSSVVPGAPGRYYPSSKTYGDTFARVVPTTAQEARADVAELPALGVRKLYVASDGQPYGAALADAVARDAAATIPVARGAADPASFKRSGANAAFFGSSSEPDSARLFDALAAESPNAKLLAPSALYDDAFASSLAPAAQRNLYVSSPGFLSQDLPAAGVKFVADFKAAYGHDPAPSAIFGYEAMAAVLGVIREASSAANSRAAVVRDFLELRDRPSVLGTYSIVHGDTTLAPFVLSRIQAGRLVRYKFVAAQG